MALLWIESFTGVDTSTLDEKYNVSGSVEVGTAPLHRRATTALICDTSGESISYTLSSDVNIMIIGFAWQADGLGSASRILEFVSPNDVVQVSLEVQTDGSIDVNRGTSTTIGSTSASVVTANEWYYIELSITIGNTGAFELRVDGIDEASNGSVDTQDDGASDQIRTFVLGALSATITNNFTDLYALDTTGAAPQNTFIATTSYDVHIHHRKPDADGTTNDWVPQGAGDNYVEVNQDAPDGDATYNSSSTVGNVDLFDFEDIGVQVDSIIGVQTNINTRRTDGPARTVEDVVRSGGANYLGVGSVDSNDVQTNYGNKYSIHEHDPDTSTEWDESGFNSAEFGYRLES